MFFRSFTMCLNWHDETRFSDWLDLPNIKINCIVLFLGFFFIFFLRFSLFISFLFPLLNERSSQGMVPRIPKLNHRNSPKINSQSFEHVLFASKIDIKLFDIARNKHKLNCITCAVSTPFSLYLLYLFRSETIRNTNISVVKHNILQMRFYRAHANVCYARLSWEERKWPFAQH